MKKLSIVHPYYKGAEALPHHYDFWGSYTDEQKEQIRIIIIDDCSPQPLHKIIRTVPGLDLQVYRIKEDLKWNQHGARNLGAMIADTPQLLMLDWDCGFRSGNLMRVMSVDIKRGQFIRFAGTRTSKPRYNQFLCWRDDYILFNGYDEDYTGTYGGDGSLMKQFEKNRIEIVMPAVMQSTPGRTPDMDREADRVLYEEVHQKKCDENRKRDRQMLRFQWERVL